MACLSGDCPFVYFSWEIGDPWDLHTHFFQCMSLIFIVRMRPLLLHCSPHVFWGPSQMGTYSLDGLLCLVLFCLQCRFHFCHWTLSSAFPQAVSFGGIIANSKQAFPVNFLFSIAISFQKHTFPVLPLELGRGAPNCALYFRVPMYKMSRLMTDHRCLCPSGSGAQRWHSGT